MGQKIDASNFGPLDFKLFQERLVAETKILKSYFEKDLFSYENAKCGFEIEGWIVDQNYQVLPKAPEYINEVNHPLVVPEISKFNFEINSMPLELGANLLKQMTMHLDELWNLCQQASKKQSLNILSIGSLPNLREEMLNVANLDPNPRYYALNKELFRLRKQRPLSVNIKGADELNCTRYDLMFEAAATSLQIHLQVEKEKSKSYYNHAMILAAPLVALCANSPFFCRKDLWAETRIPLFEQAVHLPSFENLEGDTVNRVTLGSGYVRESLFELFAENLKGYPPLLPVSLGEDPQKLAHLRFHNGTVWRWVRPIIGCAAEEVDHLRIEQRVASSGPTRKDMVANTAFFLGAVYALTQKKLDLDKQISFRAIKENLKVCARDSLVAEVEWLVGERRPVKELLRDVLLPLAVEGLELMGCQSSQVKSCMRDIIAGRLENGQNGSCWQRRFVQKHNGNFDLMLERYVHFQEKNLAVHEWGLDS